MSSYQNAIRSIAAQALNGDDVDYRVTSLANMFGLDRSNVSHEVDEMIDVLKD